eukprot:1162076-Pelagomonas_calceolata.AAC.9
MPWVGAALPVQAKAGVHNSKGDASSDTDTSGEKNEIAFPIRTSCEARVRRRAAVLLPFAPSTEHPTRCCACGSISGEGTVEKLLCKGAGGNALLVD